MMFPKNKLGRLGLCIQFLIVDLLGRSVLPYGDAVQVNNVRVFVPTSCVFL